jgi:hypothetical protein
MDSFTSKTLVRVHSSDNDYYFEIGEDQNGLGSVEIRYYEKEKSGEFTRERRMSFDPASIDLVIAGLRTIQNELKGK